MSERKETPHRRPRSLFGPLLLIALGIVFLLNNLGILRGDGWNTVVQLWPLILIVIGLDSLYQRQGLVGAIFIIGLGTVFLLSNFNLLNVNAWQLVLRLWPLLLVAIGLDLIVGRRSLWASLAGLAVLLAILAGVLWLQGVRLGAGQVLSGQEVRQSFQGATRAEIILQSSAGDVYIHSLPGSNELIAGQVASGKSRRIFEEISMQGEQANYRLREDENFGYFWGRAGQRTWDLGLTPTIPLEIHYSQGAGVSYLDLSELQVYALRVNMGVGQTTVTLPAKGEFDGRIEGAVGQLIIIVPKGMELRVRSNLALANIITPAAYRKRDRVYTSPGYETAANRIDLEVGMAVGNVMIREK